MNWSALVGHDTGGSPILTYNLQIDAGSGWIDLQGEIARMSTLTTSITNSLTPG
jgi:hypothetical protein